MNPDPRAFERANADRSSRQGPWIGVILLLLCLASGAAAGDPSGKPTTDAKEHWAFKPPTRPTLPIVSRPDWSSNAVDRFILARLEAEHLEPSPEADRRTLIRRLYLVMLGMPPTPEEVAAFVSDRGNGRF